MVDLVLNKAGVKLGDVMCDNSSFIFANDMIFEPEQPLSVFCILDLGTVIDAAVLAQRILVPEMHRSTYTECFLLLDKLREEKIAFEVSPGDKIDVNGGVDISKVLMELRGDTEGDLNNVEIVKVLEKYMAAKPETITKAKEMIQYVYETKPSPGGIEAYHKMVNVLELPDSWAYRSIDRKEIALALAALVYRLNFFLLLCDSYQVSYSPHCLRSPILDKKFRKYRQTYVGAVLDGVSEVLKIRRKSLNRFFNEEFSLPTPPLLAEIIRVSKSPDEILQNILYLREDFKDLRTHNVDFEEAIHSADINRMERELRSIRHICKELVKGKSSYDVFLNLLPRGVTFSSTTFVEKVTEKIIKYAVDHFRHGHLYWMRKLGERSLTLDNPERFNKELKRLYDGRGLTDSQLKLLHNLWEKRIIFKKLCKI